MTPDEWKYTVQLNLYESLIHYQYCDLMIHGLSAKHSIWQYKMSSTDGYKTGILYHFKD